MNKIKPFLSFQWAFTVNSLWKVEKARKKYKKVPFRSIIYPAKTMIRRKMTWNKTFMTSQRPYMKSNLSVQIQNIIETDFILTKENNNQATRMEPRISAGEIQVIFILSPISREGLPKFIYCPA